MITKPAMMTGTLFLLVYVHDVLNVDLNVSRVNVVGSRPTSYWLQF